MNIIEKVRILMIKCGNMSVGDLADGIGTTRQNIYNKFRRGDLRVSELQQIADATGTELVIKFVLPNGDEV